MSQGNGLSLNDVGILETDLADLKTVYDLIEVNALTKEQVKEQFDKFSASLKAEQKAVLKTYMKCLAAFIFVNGIHESLKDSLNAGQNISWAMLKQFFDFRASKKQTILRWVVDIIHRIHAQGDTNEKNLLINQSVKWGLEEELSEIPVEFRYFGSYFHPEAEASDRRKILNFQKKVIALSGGGVVTKK